MGRKAESAASRSGRRSPDRHGRASGDPGDGNSGLARDSKRTTDAARDPQALRTDPSLHGSRSNPTNGPCSQSQQRQGEQATAKRRHRRDGAARGSGGADASPARTDAAGGPANERTALNARIPACVVAFVLGDIQAQGCGCVAIAQAAGCETNMCGRGYTHSNNSNPHALAPSTHKAPPRWPRVYHARGPVVDQTRCTAAWMGCRAQTPIS